MRSPGWGGDGVIEDVASPSPVGDLHLAQGTGCGEHTPLDLLSLQGRSRCGGTGVDVAVLHKGHLCIRTVIDDDAGLLLLEDIGHEHHGYGIGTDLVGDRGRDVDLGVGHSDQSEGFRTDDVPEPGG